ncbi:MAG: maltose ABC transporter substrate-binding protein [Alkaliphilus sp.]
MKRFFSLLLVLVLILSFTACQRKDDPKPVRQPDVAEPAAEWVPEEGATLLVWEVDGPEGEFTEYVAQKFYEKYGVKVTYEPVNHTDSREKLSLDGPAGVGADVFAIPHDHMGLTVAMGLALPNEIGKDRITNDFMQAAVDGVTMDGILYGFPTGIETYLLFYNRDLLDKTPTTFDEVIKFAKDYNDPAQNKFGLMWDVGNAYFSHGFVAGFGGYVFGDGGTNKNELGLNSPGAVKGAEFFVSLKEILPLNSADTDYGVMDGLFSEGKAAMIINGPWAVQGYLDAGVNFGLAPLPLLPNGKNPASFSGIRTLLVSSFTKYPIAAQMFADFATSDEMLLRRFEITKQIPPVKALMNESAIKDNELVAPFLAQAQHAVPMPSIPQMDVVWEPYATALQIMWNDGVDPQEALDNAVETIEAAIAGQ